MIYDFWAPTWLWWSNIGNWKLIPIKEDLGDVHFWLWDSVAVADRLQIFGLFKFNLQSANQFANWRKWAFELVYYTKSKFCIIKQYFHIVKSCPKYYIFVMIFFFRTPTGWTGSGRLIFPFLRGKKPCGVSLKSSE